MLFKQSTSPNCRKFNDSNDRFIYLRSEEFEKIRTIESEIESLEEQLEKATTNQARNTLNQRIAELEWERGNLPSTQSPIEKEMAPESLLYAFGGSVQELKDRIGREKNEIKKKALEKLLEACEGYLEKLRNPAETPTQFNDLLNQWTLNNKQLARLESDELDYLDLDYLFNDLKGFLDEGTAARIELASEQMKVAEQAFEAKSPVKTEELHSLALLKWHKNRRQLDIDLMNAVRQGNDQMIRLIEKELNDPSDEYVRGQIKELEARSLFKLRDRVPDETLEKMRALALEARKIRENAFTEYLTGRQAEALNAVERLASQKPRRVSKAEEKRMQKAIKKGGKTIREGLEKAFNHEEWDPLNADAYSENLRRQLSDINDLLSVQDEHLVQIEDQLSFFDEFATEEGRRNFREDLQLKYQNVKTIIAECTPERIQKILAHIDKEEKEEYGKVGVSARYRKMREPFRQFLDPNSELYKQIAVVDGLVARVDTLEPEELADLLPSLNHLQEKMLPFSGKKLDWALNPDMMPIAIKARKVINDLKDVTDISQIQEILTANLGKDSIDIVSGSQFKKYKCSDGVKRNLNEYTGGNMVFYEHGDEWKIIINKDAMEDGANQAKQITHELLHLEFEKSDIKDEEGKTIKDRIIELYKGAPEKPNPHWDDIKQAFADEFPDKRPPGYEGSPPFSPDNWKDEDVISELYAMNAANADKEGALSEAIQKAGIPQMAMNIVNEKGEPVIRGFDEEGKKASSIMAEAKAIDSTSVKADEVKSKDYARRIKKIQEEIKRIMNSEYIGQIPGGKRLLGMMKNFNEDTEKLNGLYASKGGNVLSGAIDERLDQIEKDMIDVNKEMEGVAKSIKNTSMNPLRHLWNNSVFLSVDDFIQVGVDFKEWMERRHKRKKSEHAARIGDTLFSKLPILGEFAHEAGARKEKAEQEEVNEWKSRLETKDAWALIDLLRIMARQTDPNKDQFKAILRVLSDKGRINWREPAIWKLLTKLQSESRLHPGDKVLLSNPVLLRQKLHTAMGAIWDYDEFIELDRKNDTSYESKKKDYIETYDKLQGHLDERMDELQRLHRQGKEADPIEYEAIMEYSLTKGKSSAENVMFHLIVGMAQTPDGRPGLLNSDRGMHLDKYLNNYPQLEWFTELLPPPTQADFKELCKHYFGPEYNRGKRENGDKFNNFYWTVIQNTEKVTQRVEKATTERGFDHDWSRAIIGAGGSGADTCERFLAGRSGQKETKPTAVQNMYVGLLQWFDENAKTPGENWENGLARQVGFAAMADGLMENVAYQSNKIITRKESIAGNTIARETPMGHHGGKSAQWHRERLQQLQDTIDPVFFKLLRDKSKVDQGKDGDVLAEEIKKHLETHYGHHSEVKDLVGSIKVVDDVFKNLQSIVNVIISANKHKMDAIRDVLVDKSGNVRK